jgi:hypothetical protein
MYFRVFPLTPKAKITVPGSHGFKDSKPPSDPSALAPWQQPSRNELDKTGHHAEVCELLADETSTIHDSLADIGEEAPPAASPTSVVESSHAVMGVGSHARMRLTLDYTQGCTLGVPDAERRQANANRSHCQTDRLERRRHTLL